jgi:hypothetical protein
MSMSSALVGLVVARKKDEGVGEGGCDWEMCGLEGEGEADGPIREVSMSRDRAVGGTNGAWLEGPMDKKTDFTKASG